MSHEVEHMSFHHLICSAFLLSFKEIRRNSHLNRRKTGLQLGLLHCLISSELSMSTFLARLCYKESFTAYFMAFSF